LIPAIPNTVKESLKAIGFSDYEILIYLTLISESSMNAKKLSKVSGVPYSRIYNILNLLLKKKMWITKDENSRPSNFSAVSPKDALTITKRHFEDVFNDHSNKILTNLTPIYQIHNIPSRIPLYIYKGSELCKHTIISLIKLAINSLHLVSADPNLLNIVYNEVIKAKMRGVRDLKLIVNENEFDNQKSKNLLKKYQDVCEIRSHNHIIVSFVIIDEVIDAFVILDQIFFHNSSYYGVRSYRIEFCAALSYYFNYLFQTAKDMSLK